MASGNKSSEGKKEEVTAFFRRAIGEVVDFTEEKEAGKGLNEKDAVPNASCNDIDQKKTGLTIPVAQKKSNYQTGTPEKRFISRKERKEAQSLTGTVFKEEKPAISQESDKEAGNAAQENKIISLKERKGKVGSTLKKKMAAAIAVVFISVVTACSFLGGDEPEPKVVDDTPMYIRIPSGMGAASIGEYLEEKQVIPSQKYFLKRLRQSGRDGDIQSGTYKVHKGMKSDEVIELLVNGRVAVIRFTIPEGYSLNDMAKSLEKEGICGSNDFLKAAKNYKGPEYIGKSSDIENPMEGYLFPDTYEIPPNATAEDIVRLMAETFDERLTDDMREAAKRYGLSLHDFVTLASLVEKEVRDDDDLPKVAQVFLKRLEIEMPIQSCATIQYLLKEPKEDLTFDDLKIDSPYNTYEHPGLPPGPIASPGEKALQATAHPSPTSYLYFVADRKGKTYYSETFEEHMEKVEKYR